MIFNLFKRKRKDLTDILKIFSASSDYITGNDSTSFAAIDLIASSFANLTGHFYNSRTKEQIKDYSLYDLLQEPNIDETKFQFFYNSVKDYFNGNVYWYKYYGGEGELISLFRLNPNSVKVKRGQLTNQKQFLYNSETYTSEQIVHIPSRYGYNGLIGKSIFNECNKIFSNTAELDNFINNSFNNSIGNRIIIDISKAYPDVTKEQIDLLRNEFLNRYSGIQNAGVPLIKHSKIEYEKIETDFKDNRSNQLVENRQFQEKEVAKLFGVPLKLLTGEETSNIESIYTIFIENAIRPIAVSFEQAINKLISLNEKGIIYFEYNYNSLMKTSLQSRIDVYAKQINNGILTPNEVRRKENLSIIENDACNTLFIGANLLPLRKDVVDSYMAGAKLKQMELNEESPNTTGYHSNLGDDKI